MTRNLWLFILVRFLAFPPLALSETVSETLDRLNQTYKAIGNTEAEFTQTVHFADFDKQVVSTGTVFLKKGSMRWDYHTPHTQQIVVHGDQILHYIPENQQVLKGPLQRRTGLPIDLFSDLGRLEAIFQISRQDAEMILIPKKDGSHMEKIVLTLSPSLVKGADLLIHEIVLYERNQNRSTFVFHHFQTHRSFRVDPFVLKIPEDVEVIEVP